MKKKVVKSALIVAFLTVAGLKGKQAYNVHIIDYDGGFLSQNIEALSDDEWSLYPGLEHLVMDLSYHELCYKTCIGDQQEEGPFYDSDNNFWYKTIRTYEYVESYNLFRCLTIDDEEWLYRAEHGTLPPECNEFIRTSCDVGDQSTMPSGFINIGENGGRWTSRIEYCSAP